MECTCKDWKENIPLTDSAITMSALHSYGNPKGYVGKPFVYCPWCKKKLKSVKEKDNEN